jgi:flagellar hook-basal body complex protein FliE
LQAVGQRQKESLLARLAEADKQLAGTAKEKGQLEAQLTRAVEQVQARSQAAADAQEKASRQMAVLRQVCGF